MRNLVPPSRPRRGVIAVAAVVALVAVTVGLVLTGDPNPASASELTRFSSCDEMTTWAEGSWQRQASFTGVGFGDDVVAESAAPTAADGSGAAASRAAGAESGATGATNVAVDGVDELDRTERLGGDLVLVTGGGRLSTVDLAAASKIDVVAVPPNAQITYDPDTGVAWVVGTEPAPEPAVTVQRVTVADDGSLTADNTWTTPGDLVDARRVGDRLHLVATDGFGVPGDGARAPFPGGPVACTDVLHPVGPSEPTATLLVSLPASGELEPTAATEVVGGGRFVHVTTEAAYVATPLWDTDDETAIHRFDLADLATTGSGRVEGHLLDQFSMSDVDGVLRVAVTVGDGWTPGPAEGGPIVDGDVIEPAPAPRRSPEVGAAPAPSNVSPAPPDIEPVPEPVPSPEPMPTPSPEPMPMPMPSPEPMPVEPSGQVRNEVVVLDTVGDLDVIGRTDRFGHPGESIHGVRFVGDVAYAVTYLQTDPFYVIDLSAPTEPKVVGEVTLPGFSSYLHPVSDTLVAGFGPDDAGQVAVKLFDVSDPTQPTVVDDLALGNESPVTWDHHAFVDLGDGRFAVPAVTYPGPYSDGSTSSSSSSDSTGPAVESSVVVVDTAAGRLDEVARQQVGTTDIAQRVLASDAGWSILTDSDLVLLDQAGHERATLPLA